MICTLKKAALPKRRFLKTLLQRRFIILKMNLNFDARATECSFINSSSIGIVASYLSRSFPLEILSKQLVGLTTEEFKGEKERN